MHMSDKLSEREILLRKAAECVLQDRNNTYGPPTQDFQRIAEMWNTLLLDSTKQYEESEKFKPHHVAIAMIALKLSRLTWAPGHFDSWVDIAGYAACGWECAVEEGKHGSKEVPE
jgi:hypothetical protein